MRAAACLLLLACACSEGPARGRLVARFEVRNQDGKAIGEALVHEAAGRADALLADLTARDPESRAAFVLREELRRADGRVSHYAARTRKTKSVDDVTVDRAEDALLWRRQIGLAIDRTRTEGADELVSEILSPEDFPAGSLLLWAELAPRLLAVDFEVERRALNVRRGAPTPVWLARREVRQLDTDAGPRAAVRYFVSTRSSGHTVWVDARDGSLLSVDNIVGDIVLAGVRLPGPAPAPAPAGVVEEERVIETPETTLAGTLTKPAAPGPHPGVLLVHGSGGMDRDEKPFYVFRELAHRLGEAGFVVARYDKRGVAASRPRDEKVPATMPRLVDDAAAYLQVLASDPATDGNCLAAVGHSEGGYLVPLLAGRDARVRRLVLLAGGIEPLFEVMRQQAKLVLSAHGMTPDEVDVALRGQKAMLRKLATDKDLPLRGLADWAPWWMRSHAGHDSLGALRSLRVPVLGLFAGGDLQVPVATQPAALRRIAAETGAPFDVEVLDGVDHVFMDDRGGRSGMGLLLDPDRRLDPRVPQRVIEWLRAHPCR